MDANRSLLITFSLYTYDGQPVNKHGFGGRPHPRDIPDPAHTVDQKWIPQTMGDAIWKLYEFETTERRDAFIANPFKVLDKATIRTPLQAFYDHWCDGEHSKSSEWFETENKE